MQGSPQRGHPFDTMLIACNVIDASGQPFLLRFHVTTLSLPANGFRRRSAPIHVPCLHAPANTPLSLIFLHASPSTFFIARRTKAATGSSRSKLGISRNEPPFRWSIRFRPSVRPSRSFATTSEQTKTFYRLFRINGNAYDHAYTYVNI